MNLFYDILIIYYFYDIFIFMSFYFIFDVCVFIDSLWLLWTAIFWGRGA